MTHTPPLTVLELMCQIIRAGWSVRYVTTINVYEWRRPDGRSGSPYHSENLLELPYRVLFDLCTGAGGKEA